MQLGGGAERHDDQAHFPTTDDSISNRFFFLTLDSLEDKEDQRWTSEVVSVRDEKMLEPTPEGIQLDLSSIESYQMNFIPVEIEGHQVDSIPLSHLFHCDVTEESSQDVILKLRRKVVRRIFI